MVVAQVPGYLHITENQYTYVSMIPMIPLHPYHSIYILISNVCINHAAAAAAGIPHLIRENDKVIAISFPRLTCRLVRFSFWITA